MKNILLINPNKDTFSNPTLVALLEELLLNTDCKITLLAPSQSIPRPEHLSGVKHDLLPELSVNWGKNMSTWLPKWQFQKRMQTICKAEKVSTILAVDPLGLIIGARIKKSLSKLRLHYLSFEIFFQDEIQKGTYYDKVKRKEIYYSRYIDHVLIQDEVRKSLLYKENNLNDTPYSLIPVSPNIGNIEKNKSSYWREKLGIFKDKMLVLHSGSVSKWSGGEYLIDLLENSLPENVFLLIHSKEKLNSENKLHAHLMDLAQNKKNVQLHDEAFASYYEYLSFLQVADIALTLYKADFSSPYTGKNISEIGLASGKFASYMSQGLPAIVTKSKAYELLQKKHDFGFLVDSKEELRKMLAVFSKESLNQKAANCVSLYENELKPTEKIKEFIEKYVLSA